MQELLKLLERYDAINAAAKRAALATVVSVNGSSYRRPGARMMIDQDGRSCGAISGGCLERDVVLHSQRVFEDGLPLLLTYDTTRDSEDLTFGIGLGCRGVIQILIESLPQHKESTLFHWVEEASRRDEVAVVATVWRTQKDSIIPVGSRLLIDRRSVIDGELPDPAVQRIVEESARELLKSSDTSKLCAQVCTEHAEILLEVWRPPVPLVLFAGGADSHSVMRLASALGWNVTLCGGKSEEELRIAYPAVKFIEQVPEVIDQCVTLSQNTAVVIMTHSYVKDLRILEQVLLSPAHYIGLMGPKTRADRLLQDLAIAGFCINEEQRSRLYAPIGLDIGAETPDEIALSILAEIKAIQVKRSGHSLRRRKRPIHLRENAMEPA